MSTLGLIGLLIAFAGTSISVVCLLAAELLVKKDERKIKKQKLESTPELASKPDPDLDSASASKLKPNPKQKEHPIKPLEFSGASESLSWAGHVATFLTCAALTLCCAILVYCFFVGDYTIEYVLQQHSNSSSSLAWLYKLSGLWAGRQGSLLFWAWLISVFNTVVAICNIKKAARLDSAALFVSQLVLTAFVVVMLFSEDNMPFIVTSDSYFSSDGTLTSAASALGMNQLLEHWAMAIHPPTLFIGYAGFTIPFAFSIASLIVNDPSAKWVNRARPYALFSWLFLSIGIGLGSVWAYVVLGWGGYWGWDAVENASLLSWLVGLALIHSMTVCRQRAAFKRWTIMCACITFAFVIVATFITRSGIVQSVHAFDGNSVSFALFAALIIVSILFGIIGLTVRWKSFSSSINETDKVESLLTKEGAYYFNNVIMLVAAVLLAYLTISSALPSFLPFGGSTVSTGTYNAIARPLGIVYLLILSCCPLLSWGKTLRSEFWRQARIPALCAILLFIVLAIYWANCLLPSYNSIIAAGGTSADELLSEGPAWYYNGLALLGFFVASLVFFNSLFMLGRTLKRSTNGTRKNGVRKNDLQKQDKATVAEATMPPDHTKNDTPKKDTQKKTAKKHGQAARFGGFLAHAALGIILIGLIGSSMYVTQVTQYVSYDEETNTSTDDIHIQDYTLKYVSNSITAQKSDATVFYNVTFDVYKGDNYLGQVNPNVQLSMKTQQQKLNVATLSFPTHDLFVVYQGANDDGALSMNVRINPLISFVWVGFGLLVVGMLIAAFGAIFKRRKAQKEGRAGSKATVSHENINGEHHTQIEQS